MREAKKKVCPDFSHKLQVTLKQVYDQEKIRVKSGNTYNIRRW
jgi:hypothetical protein